MLTGHNPSSASALELLETLESKFQRTQRRVEVDFRTLVSWVRLGDQFTHQTHSYPAKLLPHIANLFVQLPTSQPGARTILDPFCGSGTVALEASLAGHQPMIADANPLALLIAKVKTTPYDPTALRAGLRKVLRRASRLKNAPFVPIINSDLWYTPKRKVELDILLPSLDALEDQTMREFFEVCFSVTARRLSQADPRISVPVRLRTKTSLGSRANQTIRRRLAWLSSTTAITEFTRVSETNIERVQTTNEAQPRRTRAIVVGTDARRLRQPRGRSTVPLMDGAVDLIVTSPPYGSAQKYIRASSLSLNWLGLAGPQELADLEAGCIGREHVPISRGTPDASPLPASYERLLISVRKRNPTRERITRHYLIELRAALHEMARVISPNGRIVIVIGNNQVCGEVLRNDNFVRHSLEECGLQLDLSLIDHIKSRGLMTKRNRTASMITRESVLVFSRV